MNVISSCASYYAKNEVMMQAVYRYDFNTAIQTIEKASRKVPERDILLYYLNKGTLYWMAGYPAVSNKFFQKADFHIEDYQKNYGKSLLALALNPKVIPYQGEYFEQILLHYYTTLNFASEKNYDAALIECKRMLLKLQKITDKVGDGNLYRRDAFVHQLMGIIYDLQKDYNNAFIAYRNALEIYENDYTAYNMPIPEQLKYDLIRSAKLTGFMEEAKDYERKFKIRSDVESNSDVSLIVFWNNGMGPIKKEASINFSIVPAGNGYVNFVNWDLELNIPVYVGDQKNTTDLTNLRFIRMALPKYISRVPKYYSAVAAIDTLNINKPFSMVEPVDAIAYQSLHDRHLKEIGTALLRLALKQIAESQLRKENEAAGLALNIFNAVSEQADTRNWQLLPYSINYTRLFVPSGKHKLSIKLFDSNTNYASVIEDSVSTFTNSVIYYQTLDFTHYK